MERAIGSGDLGAAGSIVSIHDLAAERLPGLVRRPWGRGLASEKTRRARLTGLPLSWWGPSMRLGTWLN